MARLDWEKNKRAKALADATHDQFYESSQEFKDPFLAKLLKKGIWPVNGKYKGKKISDLPTHYLKWIIENFEHNSNRTACINELSLRQETPTKGNSTKSPSRRETQISKIQAQRLK